MNYQNLLLIFLPEVDRLVERTRHLIDSSKGKDVPTTSLVKKVSFNNHYTSEYHLYATSLAFKRILHLNTHCYSISSLISSLISANTPSLLSSLNKHKMSEYDKLSEVTYNPAVRAWRFRVKLHRIYPFYSCVTNSGPYYNYILADEDVSVYHHLSIV